MYVHENGLSACCFHISYRRFVLVSHVEMNSIIIVDLVVILSGYLFLLTATQAETFRC